MPSQRCMRDLGTDSIPTGYKLMRRVSHTVGGLRLGSKVNLRRVVRLDKQTEPRPAHSWHGHYVSARAFAVNPARLKARPLRARGLTAQRCQARGSSCQQWDDAPRGKVATPCSVRLARFVAHGSRKRLTPQPSYKSCVIVPARPSSAGRAGCDQAPESGSFRRRTGPAPCPAD